MFREIFHWLPFTVSRSRFHLTAFHANFADSFRLGTQSADRTDRKNRPDRPSRVSRYGFMCSACRACRSKWSTLADAPMNGANSAINMIRQQPEIRIAWIRMHDKCGTTMTAQKKHFDKRSAVSGINLHFLQCSKNKHTDGGNEDQCHTMCVYVFVWA